MRTTAILRGAALFLAGASSALAGVHYVDVTNTNATPPYTSWTTAATNIQDAVDAAMVADEIVVTNGTYATGGREGNRVKVDKALNLRSLNGSGSTIILGPGRCVYLANGASLCGFTLTNGSAPQGGGLWCESTNALVYNCVIAGNRAYYGTGGGAYQGTLNNCTLSYNSVEGPIRGAGGSAVGGGAADCMLNNCALTRNSAWGQYTGWGGGAAACTLNNCTLTGNFARGDLSPIFNGQGGGAAGCTLNNCIVYFNTAAQGANCSDCTLNYSCTTPLPPDGLGNITNAPLFVYYAYEGSNLRLQSNSPCINAGNNGYVSVSTDLDGYPRIKGGTVDIGAYEFEVVHYVDVNSASPAPPYTNWTTAAINLQDAVDAAVAGDEIVVTNGIYAAGGRSIDGITTNVAAVDKPLSLQSINGPQFTTIDGGHSGRCVYLTNNDSLSGFTLRNGVADLGGGVFCESTNALVSNCVLNYNSANSGGGASGCTLNNCTLTGNNAYPGPSSAYGGGAANSILNNCTLTGNHAYKKDTRGSGAAFGGGAAGCTLNNCMLSGNSAIGQSGCNGGFGGGAYACGLNNCTLAGNLVAGECHNSFGGGAAECTLNNCIVYFNTNNSPSWAFGGATNYEGGTLSHCCTTPDPGVIGNITDAPLFVDLAVGKLRLQFNSPCINAGLNTLAPTGTDLDGYPRIKGGTVDIGAYEFQAPTSVISYAWLQQFALPTDGSADFVDRDGDGLNNWQEWRCGTDPTNALSALRVQAPVRGANGIEVRWQSVAGVSYFVERSATSISAFAPLATGIRGQPGTTTFTDTNAIGAGPWFYRVGVSTP